MAPDLTFAHTLVAIGDINRDGRDDVWLVYSANGLTQVDVLRSGPTKLSRSHRWTSSTANPMPFAKLKICSADVTYDGMADLVLFRDEGTNGTSLITLRSGYTNMKIASTLLDPTLDWSATLPY